MNSVLLPVAVLACPVGMGLMMWFMAKGMRKGGQTDPEDGLQDVDALRVEHRRLGAQIDQLDAREAGRDSRLSDARL